MHSITTSNSLGLRILVAPLNWGLGHATRSIPIIRELLDQGAEVFLASDMEAGKLLQAEFPDLPYFELSSYKVHYKTQNMVLNLAFQFPKIINTVLKEHIEIEKIVEREQIDAVITDNRFGCYSKQAYSIFITHQVNVLIGNKLTERTVRYLNRKFMDRFDEVWIPDYEGTPNLSGVLAHGIKKGEFTYLGPLSRMKEKPNTGAYDLAVILSGPEPQRTYLERKILPQLVNFDGKVVLVRGKADAEALDMYSDHLEIHNFCKSKELNEIIAASDVILSRSGYSTVMDLAKMGKKSIMIATPGQSEQEYLAKMLSEANIIHSETQQDFDLQRAMTAVENTSGFDARIFEDNDLAKVINQFLEKIMAGLNERGDRTSKREN
ncbi:MAG: glycosyltransferase [Saprospiraceae bacterium]